MSKWLTLESKISRWDLKAGSQRNISIYPCSQQHYSRWPNSGSSPRVHQRMNGYINKIRYIRRTEYYMASRRKEIQTHTTTCMSLESTIWSKIIWTEKDKHGKRPLIGDAQSSQFGNGKSNDGCRGLGGEEESGKVLFHVERVAIMLEIGCTTL